MYEGRFLSHLSEAAYPSCLQVIQTQTLCDFDRQHRLPRALLRAAAPSCLYFKRLQRLTRVHVTRTSLFHARGLEAEARRLAGVGIYRALRRPNYYARVLECHTVRQILAQ